MLLSKNIRKPLTLFSLLVLCLAGSAMAPNAIKASFDERVDLMAMIARLSGNREYNVCVDSAYAAQADQYFSKYADHEAVRLYRQIRQSDNVVYDAVVAYAVHLKFTGSRKHPLDFDENIRDGSDSSFERWPRSGKKTFLKSLNDFYTETGFHEWYKSTEPVRRKYLEKEQKSYDMVDLSWYENFFYRKPKLQTGIFVCLLTGLQNYGLSWELTDGTTVINPVYGVWKWTDLIIVIHEFCHPYCNPLVNKYWDRLSDIAGKVYEENREALSRTAYTSPQIMMYETLVRASTIVYIKEKLPKFYSSKLIENEKMQGFPLVEPVFNSLLKYCGNRSEYPTLGDYFPVLIEDLQQ